MSNEILFRTQLASIMEVLANAAVEEICKLVDDGYTVLHLQMSEYQKENETLKMRLHLMELNCAQRERPPERYADGAVALREKRRATAKDGPTVSGKRLHGSPGDVCLQVLHTDVGEDNTGATFGLKQVETAEAENDGSGSILIKEEVPVEHSDPPAALQIPVQGALGLRVSSAESSEEPPELRGTGHGTGVWEVSGLEAVLRLQAGNMAAQRLGNAGSECRAGMGTLGARGSQSAVVYETAGHSQTLAEDKDQSRPFHGGDSERYPAVPRELAGARVRPPPSDSPDLVADVVVIDSVKEEAVTLLSQWDKEPTVPVRADSQHGRRRDDRETELEPRPDPVNPSSLSRDWSTSGEIASNPDAGSLNGLIACEISFGASANSAAGCNNSDKEKRFICRYCGKAFSRQNALEIHQRVHTGEKPFRCAQCGKRFSDSSNHRRHQSVHSRERPFSCTQCQRSFSHHYQLKTAEAENDGSGSILIKEEVPVEHSDPPAALQIPVQGALGLRVSSAESSEEPPELRGTGHGTGVWEVSGLEAVLRLQAGNMAAQRLGNAGSECRAGMGTLGARGSQSAVVYETPGHSQTLTEDKDQSRPFHGGDSERYPAVPRELAGARVRPPPSDSPDLVADVVVIDSVKEEAVTLLSQWDKEPTVPVRADSQHGRRRDDRETELEPRPDPVNPSSLSRDWSTSGEIASNPDAGSLKGRNLAVSGNFAAGCNNSATEKRFICRRRKTGSGVLFRPGESGAGLANGSGRFWKTPVLSGISRRGAGGWGRGPCLGDSGSVVGVERGIGP
ncbi:hypothetical protein COCON_G00101090 [Conger conger]|uniref:C2H2-type domain-containing protein n=1 Tax=Conger conger TaxID=82655 RepID=A0A9Q1DHK0_CONCO|nr:hypothetical protein COCON_G00101090 [Conger conger]